jgi:hypothetical protein
VKTARNGADACFEIIAKYLRDGLGQLVPGALVILTSVGTESQDRAATYICPIIGRFSGLFIFILARRHPALPTPS